MGVVVTVPAPPPVVYFASLVVTPLVVVDLISLSPGLMGNI